MLTRAETLKLTGEGAYGHIVIPGLWMCVWNSIYTIAVNNRNFSQQPCNNHCMGAVVKPHKKVAVSASYTLSSSIPYGYTGGLFQCGVRLPVT